MMLRNLLLALLLVAPLGAGPVLSADVLRPAPGTGALQELLRSEALQPGTRIELSDGPYGGLYLHNRAFDPPLVIAAAPGATPRLTGIGLFGVSGVALQGLTVRPDAPKPRREPLVRTRGSADILIDGLDIASTDDTAGWTAEDWRLRARSGIELFGRDITVRNTQIRNVLDGINAWATGAVIEHTRVSHFTGDGMRGLGDDSIYRDNHIDTCIKIDGNHDDGFQSWSRGPERRPGAGVVRNVRFERNRIENGDHPLTCVLQGVGLFDGIYEDWVIADNVIIVDQWHGIAVMGARNVEITRNIVVDARPGNARVPWITITEHKDGRASEDSLVHRNVTPRALGASGPRWRVPRDGVQAHDNRVVADPARALETRF